VKRHLGAIVVAFALTLGGACANMPPTRSFPELPTYISNGDAINVRERNGDETSGTLIDLSPRSLAFLTRAAHMEMDESRVGRIQRRQTQRARGALFGLGAGLVIGIIAGRSAEESGCQTCDAEAAGLSILVTMGLGAAVGAIVGTIVKAHKTVYVAPPLPGGVPPP
jgi:hypothetical protein